MGCSSGGCASGGCSSGGCNKVNVFDWFSGMPIAFGDKASNMVEVSFKQGARKDFCRNPNNIILQKGDLVTVETNVGIDVAEVSLTGELVKLQIKKKGAKETADNKFMNILRIATEKDIEQLKTVRAKEHETMIKARLIAREYKLEMKIGDVEFSADGKKATFFYTADDRVDFRELIKRYAGEFKTRVEMRQIGARQEAARIGGIGSCGRELCCSTWLSDFPSVTTGAARYQNLSINIDKLSGQCGRLKCCLNYELDSYMDALKTIPSDVDRLQTEEGAARLRKTEIFKQLMWFTVENKPGEFFKLPAAAVIEINKMNKEGKKPASLTDFSIKEEKPADKQDKEEDLVGQVQLKALEKNPNAKNKNKKFKKKNNNNKQGNKPENEKGKA